MTMLVIASLLASPVVVADDTQDIPTNAQNTGAHDALVAALSHAGLVSALQADGPFTVFAPTDEAFAAFIESSDTFASAEDLLGFDGRHPRFIEDTFIRRRTLGEDAAHDLLPEHVFYSDGHGLALGLSLIHI